MGAPLSTAWSRRPAEPILRIPPFPGATSFSLSRALPSTAIPATDESNIRAYVTALGEARVGGAFWGAQPHIGYADPIIARPSSVMQAREMLAYAAEAGLADQVLWWLPSQAATASLPDAPAISPIYGDCDPWHLFSHASAIWLDLADENVLLAQIAGISVLSFEEGGSRTILGEKDILQRAREQLAGVSYSDPFTGEPSDILSAIALLKYWRGVIDYNRPIVGAAGFAYWKKAAVAPLLWGGGEPVRFMSANKAALDSVDKSGALAIWKSRVPKPFLHQVEQRGGNLFEVEDGFIRSAGLGADCVPPLSIVVDKIGVHFDPAQPSELENLLQFGEFSPAILERAERLRRLIIETGVSKYGAGGEAMDRPGGRRRHVLVTGQVEDDRSVLSGGGDVAGNLDLLRRARAQEPDSYIIYKPHPDVEAGHRKGLVPKDQALSYADSVVPDAPISSLLDMVDGVHVLTSLAGFEALIRGKQVTTHGVPFYAGWGLTTDLGSIPARRTARRDVIEMVAAVLLLYPRYLDPVTSLPCPPEVLVKRLVAGIGKENWAIVSLRRLQGSARQKLSKMGITI